MVRGESGVKGTGLLRPRPDEPGGPRARTPTRRQRCSRSRITRQPQPARNDQLVRRRARPNEPTLCGWRPECSIRPQETARRYRANSVNATTWSRQSQVTIVRIELVCAARRGFQNAALSRQQPGTGRAHWRFIARGRQAQHGRSGPLSAGRAEGSVSRGV